MHRSSDIMETDNNDTVQLSDNLQHFECIGKLSTIQNMTEFAKG